MSKVCTHCDTMIPDHLLVCPACTERQSYKAILALQRNYIGFVRKGDIPLILSKPSGHERWHVALTGFKQLAWCGQRIEPQWRSRRLKWPDFPLQEPDLCELCRVAIGQAMEELEREVA